MGFKMDYNFHADLLNKFSQFTPAVQAFIIGAVAYIIVAPVYILKEIVRIIVIGIRDGRICGRIDFLTNSSLR